LHVNIGWVYNVQDYYYVSLKCCHSIADGYTVSDVVMYWRDEPVVGVEDAELPQFTIVGWETNERKIKLATGMWKQKQNFVLPVLEKLKEVTARQ